MTIYNFAMLNVPFANGAISTEIAPFPDWNRGLGIAFEQTEGKPEMKGLNGLFQVLTTSMLYLKQRGIAEWDATLEYPANAFVTEGARLYKAKRVNTNKQPSLSQLDWDVWASISDIQVSTNGNLKKTVAADGGVTLEVPTASYVARGAVRFATALEVANRSNVQAAVRPSDIPQPSMVPDATTSTKGIVQLNNTLTSTSTTQALTAAQGRALNMQMLGVGQTWQNLTGSRSPGVTYTNSTGKPIQVNIKIIGSSNRFSEASLRVGSVLVAATDPGNSDYTGMLTAIIPNGSTYSVSLGTGTSIGNWAELR